MINLIQLVENVAVQHDHNANQRQAVALVNHLMGENPVYRAEVWADAAGNEVLIIVKNGRPLGNKTVGRQKVKVKSANA